LGTSANLKGARLTNLHGPMVRSAALLVFFALVEGRGAQWKIG